MVNDSIGNYDIIRLIGEGGMASVYEAKHKVLGTKVAIKVLNPILSANHEIRERFKNEVILMASLNHPNITRVIDFDEQSQQLYIILEYLEGEDLNQKIKKQGALSEDEVSNIFDQILSAFQYIHEKGIAHRDIKPSNIFILTNGQVKILDFGIAKSFGQGNEMTQTGMQVGTPVYMSPEQVRAEKSIDHRSDIYSLGVTLFFALNGEPPYKSDTTSQYDIFNKIVHDSLPEVKGSYNEIIKKACNKDRDQRFQTCKEWLDYTKNKTVEKSPEMLVEPPQPPPEVKKKRNFLPLTLIVLIIGALSFFIYDKTRPEDFDQDGVPDINDECPEVSGNSPNGCFYSKEVKFTNTTDNKIYLAIGFKHNNKWKSEGWFVVPPNGSYTYMLPMMYTDAAIYYYGWKYDQNNKFKGVISGNGKKLCIDGDRNFKNNGSKCSLEDQKWFLKLKLVGEITQYDFTVNDKAEH